MCEKRSQTSCTPNKHALELFVATTYHHVHQPPVRHASPNIDCSVLANRYCGCRKQQSPGQYLQERNNRHRTDNTRLVDKKAGMYACCPCHGWQLLCICVCHGKRALQLHAGYTCAVQCPTHFLCDVPCQHCARSKDRCIRTLRSLQAVLSTQSQAALVAKPKQNSQAV